MRVAIAVLAILAVSASGCVTELLGDPKVTTRNVACAAISPDLAPQLRITIERQEDVLLDLSNATHSLATQLAAIGRPTESIVVDETGYVEPTNVELWLEELPRFDRQGLRVYVQLLDELPNGDAFLIIDPGVVAMSESAIYAGAVEAGLPVETVIRAVFLHAMGHTFGVVNNAIPLNSTATEGREAKDHHEADEASVMFGGWHSSASMPKSNATYMGYSDPVLDDWRGALNGVCA